MTSDPDSMTRSPPLGKQPSQCKVGGASPHEGPPVNVGDLVLCRLGCKYWPAICSELPTDGGRSDKARFIFFGDHKELVTSVASARRSVRPFSDLSQLAARDKPSCHLYDVAVEEAQQWHGDMQLYHHANTDGDSVVAEQHAHEAMHTVSEVSSPHDDPGDGDWTINGEVVPLQLLLRANLRRLPKYGSTALVPVSTPLSPAPTFRVINDIGSTSRGGDGVRRGNCRVIRNNTQRNTSCTRRACRVMCVDQTCNVGNGCRCNRMCVATMRVYKTPNDHDTRTPVR